MVDGNDGAVYAGFVNVTVTMWQREGWDGGRGGKGGREGASNTFGYYTAAYCGTIDIAKSHRYRADLIGNSFSYNRVMGMIAGSNGGGVVCIRNASVLNLVTPNSAQTRQLEMLSCKWTMVT